MTIVDALLKSPVGMAVRRYNDLLRQVVTRDRRAFFINPDNVVSACDWPGGGDNWHILNVGKTHGLIADEQVLQDIEHAESRER